MSWQLKIFRIRSGIQNIENSMYAMTKGLWHYVPHLKSIDITSIVCLLESVHDNIKSQTKKRIMQEQKAVANRSYFLIRCMTKKLTTSDIIIIF